MEAQWHEQSMRTTQYGPVTPETVISQEPDRENKALFKGMDAGRGNLCSDY